MVLTDNNGKTFCRQSLWNRGLVALFIILFFLEGVTRYKHIVSGLMYATALYYGIKYRKQLLSLFKNNLAISLMVFVLMIVYSIIISIDPSHSFKKSGNHIFEQLMLVSFVIPVVLHRESKESIAKLLVYSLIIALLPLAIADGYQYYQEYIKGIMPFTQYEHKYKSDALIFMMPALLYLWERKERFNKVLFLCALPIVGFMILGTMQRGTWLAILIPAVIWCIVRKEWKLPVVISLILGLLLSSAALNDPQPFHKLFYKMQQTSSSARYGGGTQGSALDLIMENPVKGYGYGADIFYRVYNSKVHEHPEWIFKKSIGPHNISLVYWYAGGIFGLLALWYLLLSLLKVSITGQKNTKGIENSAWLLISLILIGDFIVRGLFESVAISNIAMLLGISLALSTKSKPD